MARPKGSKNKAKTEIENGQLTDATNSNLILGWLVSWTICAATKSLNAMQTLIDNTLGTAFMPRQPKDKVKLARAMDSISDNGQVRRIKEDKDVIYYALVDEVPDVVNIDIDLEKLAIAAYFKKKGQLEFRGGTPAMQEKIRLAFAQSLGVFDEFQIRQVAADFINSRGAIRYFKDGRLYFHRNHSDIQALESYILALANGSEVAAIPIYNMPAAKKYMVSLIKKQLENELIEAGEEIKRMASSKFTRTDTFDARLKAFKEQRDKCMMYSDLLKADAELLAAQVDTMRDEVCKAVAGEMEPFKISAMFPIYLDAACTIKTHVIYDGDKQDKYGTTGSVSGYQRSETGKEYVRVHFDKSDSIVPCSPNSLKIV